LSKLILSNYFAISYMFDACVDGLTGGTIGCGGFRGITAGLGFGDLTSLKINIYESSTINQN